MGATTGYVKVTIAPDGALVSVKDKLYPSSLEMMLKKWLKPQKAAGEIENLAEDAATLIEDLPL